MTVQRLVPVIGCTPTTKEVDTFKFARRGFLNSISCRLDLTTMVYIGNIPNLCNVPKTPVENGPIDHISQRGIFTLLSTYSAGVLPLTSVPSWCGILH